MKKTTKILIASALVISLITSIISTSATFLRTDEDQNFDIEIADPPRIKTIYFMDRTWFSADGGLPAITTQNLNEINELTDSYCPSDGIYMNKVESILTQEYSMNPASENQLSVNVYSIDIDLNQVSSFYIYRADSNTEDEPKYWGAHSARISTSDLESNNMLVLKEYEATWSSASSYSTFIYTNYVKNQLNYGQDLYKTIFFYNSSGYSTPYAYAWNSSTGVNNNNWPGLAMTKKSANIYSINIKTTFNMIIFNNNGGSQTADLAINNTNHYYNGSSWASFPKIVYAGNYKSSYNSNMYIYLWNGTGANTWPGTKMYKEGSIYSIVLEKTNTCTHLIFNNGSGTQTSNLVFTNQNSTSYSSSTPKFDVTNLKWIAY